MRRRSSDLVFPGLINLHNHPRETLLDATPPVALYPANLNHVGPLGNPFLGCPSNDGATAISTGPLRRR